MLLMLLKDVRRWTATFTYTCSGIALPILKDIQEPCG